MTHWYCIFIFLFSRSDLIASSSWWNHLQLLLELSFFASRPNNFMVWSKTNLSFKTNPKPFLVAVRMLSDFCFVETHTPKYTSAHINPDSHSLPAALQRSSEASRMTARYEESAGFVGNICFHVKDWSLWISREKFDFFQQVKKRAQG